MGDNFSNIVNSKINNRSFKGIGNRDENDDGKNENNKIRLKRLFFEESLMKCIKVLVNYFENGNNEIAFNNAAIYLSKLKELKQEINLGTITREDYIHEKVKIKKGVLELIDAEF